jgi:hypothetical protein
VPHNITIYDGQPHAFVQDAQGIKAGGAQGEAWDQMLTFLDSNLKSKSTQRQNGGSLAYDPVFTWKYYAMLAYEHAFGTASHLH